MTIKYTIQKVSENAVLYGNIRGLLSEREGQWPPFWWQMQQKFIEIDYTHPTTTLACDTCFLQHHHIVYNP